MEETKKTRVQMPKRRQKPVKTQWNAQCVLLTYFQGDISSVVDEHFSRALSKLKRPQGWSSCRHGENVVLKNELKEVPVERKGSSCSMPPNQWHLTPSWTKPQPEASLANGASSSSSSLDKCGPKALDQNLLSVPKTPAAHPQEMWPFSSLARPDFLEAAYFRVFPNRPPAPVVYPDGRRGSLLHLLQQDRYLNRPLEPAARENCNPAKTAGSSGLHGNLPLNSEHCKETLTDTCKVIVVGNKKIYGHEYAYPSFGNEKKQLCRILSSEPKFVKVTKMNETMKISCFRGSAFSHPRIKSVVGESVSEAQGQEPGLYAKFKIRSFKLRTV
ncbi:transcription cofactor vestigial-like protein 1 [Microtus ochrogaster]|uniref:Transcription cofactor vestigial-like protein 1 n=1 Tax=Microtus ochrogaster TaxID=79684 RepID=A0ABM1APP3_MICOH|nr:transcription cofactor vestigial-like protein 1 [Microtus ochrogaster]